MENNINLDSKEIFSFAFASTKKYFAKFFVVVLALGILSAISPEDTNGPISSLLSLISIVGTFYVTIAMYGAIFKILSGQDVSIGDMFTWPKNGLKMLWANILAGLAIAPFLITAIILGVGSFFSTLGGGGSATIVLSLITLSLALLAVYFSIRLMFAKYYALDTGAGAVESVKYSWGLTKGKFLSLFWLSILMGCIVILGIIALIIGLFWAIPTVLIAQVLIYKKLSGSNNVPAEIVGGSILPEAQPLELEAQPSVTDTQQ